MRLRNFSMLCSRVLVLCCVLLRLFQLPGYFACLVIRSGALCDVCGCCLYVYGDHCL